ncbi:hypothetical protein [Phytohabitans aurantiacus]|jgi:hypothetical protein|uniref:hypothetical protein n=1 Tax=Phytohabitans aurantiacus TaxID=3016789 RepID=UPI00248F9A3D|nr:hypothetical protein [Phytohabitans aurantiacus]
MSPLNVTATRCEALFVSAIQDSDEPSAEQVRAAVLRAIRDYGVRNCVARVAQEFGDHPDAAVARMRWARDEIQRAYTPKSRGWSTRTTPHLMAASALPPVKAA